MLSVLNAGIGQYPEPQAPQFKNSDFPTPRGYEQAVHPPFNSVTSVILSLFLEESYTAVIAGVILKKMTPQ